MQRFKHTTEGYLAAKKWLQSKNVWDRVIQSDLTTNTQSVIEIANALVEKLDKNKLVKVSPSEMMKGQFSECISLDRALTKEEVNVFYNTTKANWGL